MIPILFFSSVHLTAPHLGMVAVMANAMCKDSDVAPLAFCALFKRLWGNGPCQLYFPHSLFGE